MSLQVTRRRTVSTTSTQTFSLRVNTLYKSGTYYKTIKQIAATLGAIYKPRTGFMYLAPQNAATNLAIWCIQLNNPNISWDNSISPNGKTICEKNRKDTGSRFISRVKQDKTYDPELLRLTFLREKGGYRFAGVFGVAQFDFKNQQIVFERVDIPSLTIKITRVRKVVIEIEDTVDITIH